MHARASQKWRIVSGLFIVACVAGADLVALQPTARASEKQQPATQLNDKELNLVESMNSVFRKAVQKVAPAVVQIEADSRLSEQAKDEEEDEKGDDKGEKNRGQRLPEELRKFFEDHQGVPGLPDEFRKFFRDRRGLRSIPRAGAGSGVIVDAEKGYVLTSAHLVADHDPKDITVYTRDKRKFSVEWVRADTAKDTTMTDVAVLKLRKPENLRAIAFGDSDKVQVGDWVLAIGGPLGMVNSVTFGIISARGRVSQELDLQYQNFMQTDAAINPGNSGGPLINLRGEMIGINTAIVSRTRQYAGIGFSLPSNLAKWVMTQLIEHEKVVRGYLGVIIQGLDERPGMAKSFGLDDNTGVVVSDVVGEPAQKAGLKVGDVVLTIEGQPVSNATELQSRIAMTSPGTKLKFKIWRDRKEEVIEVVVGKQPKDFRAWVSKGRVPDLRPEEAESAMIETLGITVEPLTKTNGKDYGWKGTEGGLLITKVEPRSEASLFQLRPGNLILRVQDQPVKSADELRKKTSKQALSEGVRIYIKDHETGIGSFLYLHDN